MPSFRDQPWEQRVNSMGDQAENKCREVYPTNLVRFGLDRPPLQVHKLPKRIRFAPDFLGTHSFVECQGFGKDQILKLKWVKLNCLIWWNELHPVEFFFYDSTNDRWRLVPLAVVMGWVDSGKSTLNYFFDTGAYFAIPAAVIFDGS